MELEDEFFDGMIDGFGNGVYHDTSVMLKDASIGSQICDVIIYGDTYIRRKKVGLERP
jgi:hypothetical protein